MRQVRPRSVDAGAVAYETLYSPGGTLPTMTGNDAGAAVAVGVQFSALVAGSVYGMRYHIAVSETGTPVAELYDGTGTVLASKTAATNPAAGDFDVLFTSPVVLSVYPAVYQASVWHPGGVYSYRGSHWAADYTSPSGHLFVAFEGGRFSYGASPLNPTTTAQTWFGVEPLFIAS